MKNENERIIDIYDDPVSDSRPTEVPQISIERDVPETLVKRDHGRRKGKDKYIKTVSIVIALTIIGGVAAILLSTLDAESSYPNVEKKVAENNISALSQSYSPTSTGTEMREDSILGVIMDIYSLDCLRASLEWQFPDTADYSLVMFMRSADYHPDGRSLGPVVVDGVGSAKKATDSRDGYVAISPSGKTVIGISSDDDIEKWTRQNKGDFFRQMVLLDDGELPRDFILRGKVERGAIASTVDGKLYYIVTRNKESMYDFADAMREYGFVDAIYMTGGNAYSFYRDTDGHSHTNSATLDKIRKYESNPLLQPLLVFRRSNP